MAVRKIEVLPRRPHKSVREELRASQRGRLICAIADSVSANGYPATSVADIIALAGVSRRTFYEHFEDKEACFLALFAAASDGLVESISEQVATDLPWAVDFGDGPRHPTQLYDIVFLGLFGLFLFARFRRPGRPRRPGRCPRRTSDAFQLPAGGVLHAQPAQNCGGDEKACRVLKGRPSPQRGEGR